LKCDADIFHGVVLVHVEIAVALELEIEGSVAREEFQHVIEEANPGRDLVLALAFDCELDRDAGLRRVALETRSARSDSRIPGLRIKTLRQAQGRLWGTH